MRTTRAIWTRLAFWVASCLIVLEGLRWSLRVARESFGLPETVEDCIQLGVSVVLFSPCALFVFRRFRSRAVKWSFGILLTAVLVNRSLDVAEELDQGRFDRGIAFSRDLAKTVTNTALLVFFWAVANELLRREEARLRAEGQLSETDARLRALFNACPDGLVVLDVRGCVLDLNLAAGEVLRRSIASLEGTRADAAGRDGEAASQPVWRGVPLVKLVPLSEQDRVEHALAGASRGQRSVIRVVDSFAVPDAESRIERVVRLEIVPLEGVVSDQAAFCRLIDATAEERALAIQREVARRTRFDETLSRLGLFAGQIAHDFGNLLTGALGRLDLLRAGHADSRELILETHVLCSESARLCRQLLDYAGEGRRPTERLALGFMVRDLERLLRILTSQRAHLRLELAEGLECIEGDAGQILQLVVNLVHNAIDACREEPRGEIVVRTYSSTWEKLELETTQERGVMTPREPDRCPRPNCVVLEVEDDGSGISPEVLWHLFEPFFSTKSRGSGLGLAGVASIARSHGARVHVTSEVGVGSVFRVGFPSSNGGRSPARFDDETEEIDHRTGTEDAGALLVSAERSRDLLDVGSRSDRGRRSREGVELLAECDRLEE